MTAEVVLVVRGLGPGVFPKGGDHLRLDQAGDHEAAPAIEAARDLAHPARTFALVDIALGEGTSIKEESHSAPGTMMAHGEAPFGVPTGSRQAPGAADA